MPLCPSCGTRLFLNETCQLCGSSSSDRTSRVGISTRSGGKSRVIRLRKRGTKKKFSRLDETSSSDHKRIRKSHRKENLKRGKLTEDSSSCVSHISTPTSEYARSETAHEEVASIVIRDGGGWSRSDLRSRRNRWFGRDLC